MAIYSTEACGSGVAPTSGAAAQAICGEPGRGRTPGPHCPWWRRACPEGVEVRGQAPPLSASDVAHPANVSARSRSIRRAPSSGNDWGAVANRYQTEGPKAGSLTGRSLHCNAHVKVGVPREEEELM
jgi:hypothetical protein